MQFPEAERHHLGILQVILGDQLFQKPGVVEDLVSQPSDRVGRIVELITQLAGKFHMAGHVGDAFILVSGEGLRNGSPVRQITPAKCAGQEIPSSIAIPIT